jgi:hypothetical protein
MAMKFLFFEISRRGLEPPFLLLVDRDLVCRPPHYSPPRIPVFSPESGLDNLSNAG